VGATQGAVATPGNRWAYSIAAITAAVALLLTIATLSTAGNAGCAFIDGRSYCAVARGQLAPEPFNRRPLVPLLVRLVQPGGVVSGFRFWSLLALGLLVAGVAKLTADLTRIVAEPRRARTAGIIAASLVLLMPHGVRLAWIYPVLTDIASMALGVGWLVVLSSRWPKLAPLVALMAILCREQWALPVLLVGAWLLLRRQRTSGWIHIGVAVAGALVVVRWPHTGRSRAMTIQQTASHFVEENGWWSLLVIVGLLGALYVTSRPRTASPSPTEVPLVLVSSAQIAVGMVGGSDVPRLVAGALPFLICLALAWSSRTTFTLIRLAVVTAGLLLLWRVWRLPSASAARYREFYRPFDIPAQELRVVVDMFFCLAIIVSLIVARFIEHRFDISNERAS
jgi:hypothetical protein